MSDTMSSKERVMKMFAGEKVDRPPCFSGMGNATTAGLDGFGYKFAQVHLDAKQMADTAASTYKLFGYDSIVLPFDLCVEAEALGCKINTYAHSADLLYPTIKEKVIHGEDDMDITIPDGIAERGRVPLMREAIAIAKKDVGDEAAIGSYLLGPFTLAGQIMELNDLLKLSFKKQDKVGVLLDKLADVIITIGKEYEKAGVDYITLREMGATSDVLSPRVFKKLIQPYMKKVVDALNVPVVIHICGKTNDIVDSMLATGAAAISVDQKNDIVETRKNLGPDALIFGNYDPYGVLVNGDADFIKDAITKCLNDGVDAVWPGCDIWPTVPPENFKTMMDVVKNYKK